MFNNLQPYQSPRILTPRQIQRQKNARANLIKRILIDILITAVGNLISGVICIFLFEIIYNS